MVGFGLKSRLSLSEKHLISTFAIGDLARFDALTVYPLFIPKRLAAARTWKTSEIAGLDLEVIARELGSFLRHLAARLKGDYVGGPAPAGGMLRMTMTCWTKDQRLEVRK